VNPPLNRRAQRQIFEQEIAKISKRDAGFTKAPHSSNDTTILRLFWIKEYLFWDLRDLLFKRLSLRPLVELVPFDGSQ
jgi:hypothetical protein